MNSTVLIPLLFPVEPGFMDMRDGDLIRVVRRAGEQVGTLHITYQPDEQRLGAIVQFCPPLETGGATLLPSSDGSFAATGHAGWPVHRLTLEELRATQRTGDSAVPFSLTVEEE